MVVFGVISFAMGLVSWFYAEAFARMWTDRPWLVRFMTAGNRVVSVVITVIGAIFIIFGIVEGSWVD